MQKTFRAAESYNGQNRETYLNGIRERATRINDDESLEDFECERAQDLEAAVDFLRAGRRRKDIHRLLSLTAVGGLVAGAFFLFSSMTGRAVSDLSGSTTNWIGTGLIIISLIAAYFYFKKK